MLTTPLPTATVATAPVFAAPVSAFPCARLPTLSLPGMQHPTMPFNTDSLLPLVHFSYLTFACTRLHTSNRPGIRLPCIHSPRMHGSDNILPLPHFPTVIFRPSIVCFNITPYEHVIRRKYTISARSVWFGPQEDQLGKPITWCLQNPTFLLENISCLEKAWSADCNGLPSRAVLCV